MRRSTFLPLIGLALLAGSALGLFHLSRARCFAVGAPTVCRVDTQRPLVALTFDDGPSALGLDAILPVLAAHHTHATFFLIGSEVAQRPDLAAQLVAAGHEVGNHSFTHRRMIGRSDAFYNVEITRTEALLRQAGARSGLFRPPYGKKLFGLPGAVRRHGLRMILWDVEDPRTEDPQAFARQVVSEARPGSIILIHAMYRANDTAQQALPLILDGLHAKGLKAVTVGELLAAASQPPR